MHDTKACDPVARVLDETQQREQILDVRGVEELQAAELHEGDVAPGQLDFERGAVVRRPEEHRLLLQACADLPVFQHALDDVAGLVGLVAHAYQPRTLGRLAVRPEVLGEALCGELDYAVGGSENRLGRTVVAIERDDLGRRAELPGKSRILRTVAARNE